MHCTVDEANRIWSKAQDSVKHKYARILKNNEKQSGFCPEENYVSKYDRQNARNVRTQGRVKIQ